MTNNENVKDGKNLNPDIANNIEVYLLKILTNNELRLQKKILVRRQKQKQHW